MSIEDDICMTDRTLRELHLLPFQTAMKVCEPWAFMTSYNKINGVHSAEDPYLITQILRKEWGFDGLVLSDWWGTYSTSEALNAGMDLEMPGPTIWRGKALNWAIESRKVPMSRVDDAVRKVLNIIAKTHDSCEPKENGDNNTEKSRTIVRKVATDSIVLLKNNKGVLPLKAGAGKIGLIGDHFKNPATSGGGSSEAPPYYISKPYDSIVGQVGIENIEFAIGAYSHRFSPLITSGLHQPDSKAPGLFVEFVAKHPDEEPTQEVLWTAETIRTQFQFADSLPEHIPERHFVRIQTVFTASKSMKYRFGLSAFGKAIMRLDRKQVIDLWTDHPEKTDITPVFNAFSMERFYDIDAKEGQEYHITIILSNEPTGPIIGMAPAGGVRLGGFEVFDEDKAMEDAVALSARVEYPIIMTGLSSDYEMESMDRADLELPRRINELIERVAEANPNTVSHQN
jgi:beta-glucosidase